MNIFKTTTLKKIYLSLGVMIFLSIGIPILIISLSAPNINIAEVGLGLIFTSVGVYSLWFSWKYFFMETIIEHDQIIHQANSKKKLIINSTDISEIKEYIYGHMGNVTATPGGQDLSLFRSYYLEVISNKEAINFDRTSINDMKLFSEKLKTFSDTNKIKWTVVQ